MMVCAQRGSVVGLLCLLVPCKRLTLFDLKEYVYLSLSVCIYNLRDGKKLSCFIFHSNSILEVLGLKFMEK